LINHIADLSFHRQKKKKTFSHDWMHKYF
jgi:hypothetical protein